MINMQCFWRILTRPALRGFVTRTVSLCTLAADRQFASEIVSLKNNAALQNKQKLMLVEGSRSLQTCIDAGLRPIALYFSREAAEDVDTLLSKVESNCRSQISLKRVSDSKIKEYSKLKTPPGIIGLFRRPADNWQPSLQRHPIYPVFVVLDNVRNPDNLGGILRTAAGSGCQALLCTTGCVSAWNDKVLRSSMLANLYIDIKTRLSWVDVEKLLPDGCGVVIADSDTNGKFRQSNDELEVCSYNSLNYATTYSKGVAIILCNEGNGPSAGAVEFWKKCAGRCIHIPMSKPIDSLNVSAAAAVILFHIVSDFSVRS